MLITNRTTITFQLPEDNKLHESFCESNDLSKWKESTCTKAVSYTRTSYYAIEQKERADK